MRLILLLLVLTACTTHQQRRDRLQAENPDCYVTNDLEIYCAPPQDFDKPDR